VPPLDRLESFLDTVEREKKRAARSRVSLEDAERLFPDFSFGRDESGLLGDLIMQQQHAHANLPLFGNPIEEKEKEGQLGVGGPAGEETAGASSSSAAAAAKAKARLPPPLAVSSAAVGRQFPPISSDGPPPVRSAQESLEALRAPAPAPSSSSSSSSSSPPSVSVSSVWAGSARTSFFQLLDGLQAKAQPTSVRRLLGTIPGGLVLKTGTSETLVPPHPRISQTVAVPELLLPRQGFGEGRMGLGDGGGPSESSSQQQTAWEGTEKKARGVKGRRLEVTVPKGSSSRATRQFGVGPDQAAAFVPVCPFQVQSAFQVEHRAGGDGEMGPTVTPFPRCELEGCQYSQVRVTQTEVVALPSEATRGGAEGEGGGS